MTLAPHPVIDVRFRPPTAVFDASAAASHQAVWWHTRSTPLWRAEHAAQPAADDAANVAARARTLDACAAWMRERNVRGVLPGRGTPGVVTPNDHLHDLCVTHPGCFVALAGVDPSQRRAAMDEVARCATLGTFAGVHLEPGWLHPPMAVDDARCYPLYAQCEDLELVLVVHIGPLGGPAAEHTHPGAVARVARDFPRLRILVAHAGYPHADDAILVVMKHANVWLAPDPYHDFPGGERYREWANRSDLVADRVCYGSSHGWPDAPEALERFERLGWRDDVLPRVLHDNAAELFGI
jgi:predicted TIM-barrel fold metal-dependent hydrolase